MFPLLLGLMATAPYIIHYYPRWHAKYEPAVFTLIFFCLNALLSSLSSILVNVLDATGRVKTTLQLMAMWTIMTWVLTPIGIHLYGYNGVAIASVLVSLTLGITIHLVKRVVEFSLLPTIIKPMIGSALMLLTLLILEHFFVRNIFSLILTILVAGLVYIISMYTLAREQIQHDISFIRNKI